MAKKKITVKTRIKKVTLVVGEEGKAGKVEPKFDKLEFSRADEETLKKWMDGKEELKATFELAQPQLPGCDE